MAEEVYEKGDRIRWTRGPLGAVAKVGATRFLDEKRDVQAGEVGYYIEEIEIDGEPWHVTSKHGPYATIDGLQYSGPFVLVSRGQFEHLRQNMAVIRRNEDGNG